MLSTICSDALNSTAVGQGESIDSFWNKGNFCPKARVVRVKMVCIGRVQSLFQDELSRQTVERS